MPDPYDNPFDPTDPRYAGMSVLIALQKAAAGPLRVRGDAGEVEQPKLTDLIAAHEYLAGTDPTVGRSPRRGIRYARLLPPGAVGRGIRYSTRGTGWGVT